MCLAQGPQRSDAGEARARGPSVSSQALYHWATALPHDFHLDPPQWHPFKGLILSSKILKETKW